MSKFLGPIHHWLFHKIHLYEDLEKKLIQAYKEKYGNLIEKISQQAQGKYGPFLETKPLDELINVNNIHGWLQHQISIVETRQAEFLQKVFEQYGKDNIDTALSIYKKQGLECGQSAKNNHNIEDAPSIYKALNDYILNGMPCDHVNHIVINKPEKLQWTSTTCLHKPYWEIAGADIHTFYKLRDAWIKAFVENANESYTYTVDGQNYTILKK
ncbi:hypothetical protein [Inediibacterium massiliense]|uniref:hypothetical protein n=1 Tax=Inediibacterium massiliense TaxID=1658111 RepID=UPI0006B45C69|nr:hypothetical protein [Inediibacterium massiliense]